MKQIIVVGRTLREAETWARENVPKPYKAISANDRARLEGLRVLTVLYTPDVGSVPHELWEQLRRLKAISGVNEDVSVEP